MSLKDKLAALEQVLANFVALADPHGALREAQADFNKHLTETVTDLEDRVAVIEEALGSLVPDAKPVEIVAVDPVIVEAPGTLGGAEVQTDPPAGATGSP